MIRNRALTRVAAGFAGLLAAGAFAAPAYADGADLAVNITGTTIAAGAEGKIGDIDLKNVGTTTPESVDVVFDISGLEGVFDFAPVCDDPADGKVVCPVPPEFIPAPGGTSDLGFLVTRVDESADASGELTVTVETEGDANAANNSDTAEVTIGDHGVDLAVVAEDVRDPLDAENSTDEPVFLDGPILPGALTAVTAFVVNQGDMTAKGVKVSVTLPQGATFAQAEEGCGYSRDNRTVTCAYDEVVLIPFEKDAVEDDEETSAAGFWFPVKIASDVAAPGSLTGGTATANALAAVEFDEQQAAPATALPENVELLDAQEIAEVVDVDPTDNTDSYTIFIGAAGGAGGGLPVTGVQAGLFGGVGLGILAVGGVLFTLARRRRLVLVTPTDEKPTP